DSRIRREMEVCSVLLCNGYTPWQGLLFTASLLTCWHLSTTAQPIIESVPPQVAEGQNVLFLVQKLPKNAVIFVWSKEVNSTNQVIAMSALNRDLSAPGPMYGNRETVYRNGSLLLRNVRKTDTGLYILQTLNRQAAILARASIFLHVHTFLWTCGRHDSSGQPTIQSVPPRIAEGGSVLLIVRNPPENIISYVWYKWLNRFNYLEVVKYRRDKNSIVWGPAYSGTETLYSDGSLMLHGITQKDPGLYTLRIIRADMGFEEADVKLYVDNQVIRNVRQPFVKITDTTVEGRRSVIFSCLSPDTDISIRWLFNNQILKLTERMTLSPTQCGLRIDPVRSEDAGEYKCEVFNRFSLKSSLPVSWP
ncbi:carcinoembryonic antigen-related cell adhesion molecule 5-like, partial [Sigmodon hispidus]